MSLAPGVTWHGGGSPGARGNGPGVISLIEVMHAVERQKDRSDVGA
jgi:hypothetical protein